MRLSCSSTWCKLVELKPSSSLSWAWPSLVPACFWLEGPTSTRVSKQLTKVAGSLSLHTYLFPVCAWIKYDESNHQNKSKCFDYFDYLIDFNMCEHQLEKIKYQNKLFGFFWSLHLTSTRISEQQTWIAGSVSWPTQMVINLFPFGAGIRQEEKKNEIIKK